MGGTMSSLGLNFSLLGFSGGLRLGKSVQEAALISHGLL